MSLELPTLQFPNTALEPHLGERTVALHLEHHRRLVERLDALLPDDDTGTDLERRVQDLPRGKTFDHAALCWNHDFYWRSTSPDGAKASNGALGAQVEADFGSAEALLEAMVETATATLQPGWVWLTGRPDGSLAVSGSEGSGSPLQSALTPLLGLDLWEHAYLIDYGNDREAYVRAWLEHLANWEFAAENHEQWSQAIEGAAQIP